MANVWMHNGFLQVEGEKMAKSLGNFLTIHELIHTTRFGGRKWSGEALRLAMLRTHYRQPIDWTAKALEEAEATVDRWYHMIGEVEPGNQIAPEVIEALYDDLNTPAAIFKLHDLAKGADPRLLKSSANLLGLLQKKFVSFAPTVTAAIEKLIKEREAARAHKNWTEADRLRNRLADLGIIVKDTKDGTTLEYREPKR